MAKKTAQGKTVLSFLEKVAMMDYLNAHKMEFEERSMNLDDMTNMVKRNCNNRATKFNVRSLLKELDMPLCYGTKKSRMGNTAKNHRLRLERLESLGEIICKDIAALRDKLDEPVLDVIRSTGNGDWSILDSITKS